MFCFVFVYCLWNCGIQCEIMLIVVADDDNDDDAKFTLKNGNSAFLFVVVLCHVDWRKCVKPELYDCYGDLFAVYNHGLIKSALMSYARLSTTPLIKCKSIYSVLMKVFCWCSQNFVVISNIYIWGVMEFSSIIHTRLEYILTR